MPFYVLLLIPKVKKFELIQFQKTPDKPTVKAVLHQTHHLTSNAEFQSLTWIGLFCPQTETCLLLPGKSFPTSTSNTNSKSTGTPSSDPSDLLSPKSVASSDFPSPTASTAPTTPVVVSSDLPQAPHESEFESESKENAQQEQEQQPEPAQVLAKDATKKDEKDIDDNMNEDDEDSYDPDQDDSEIIPLEDLGLLLVAIPQGHKLKHVQKQANKIINSPAFSILTQGQSMQRQPKTPLEIELELLKNASKAKQMSQQLQQQNKKNELSTAAYQMQQQDLETRRQKRLAKAPATGNPSPDSHGLSPLDQFRLQQHQQTKQARMVEQHAKASQAHHSDTSGRLSVTSNTAPNTNNKGEKRSSLSSSCTSQSLEKADAPSSSHQNETEIVVSKDYQDIQSRLEAASTSESSPTAKPKTKTFHPTQFDKHGLNPIDQLRVQQNQQKAQQRQQEQTWKPGYVDPETTIVNTLDPEVDPQRENPFETHNDEDDETPFISAAQARQQELAAKQQAELEALQQTDVVQSKAKSYLAAVPQIITRSSSWNEPPRNRATKSIVKSETTTTTGKESSEPQGRPALTSSQSAQGLLEETGGLSTSLHYIPPADSKAKSANSSLSELKELHDLKLAQNLKTQFMESAQRNAMATEAFRAQQRDLEVRKSQTKPFAATQNTLSAADATQLELSKQKKEEFLKTREALGYYKTRKEGEDMEEKKEWKTKGQVLTTQGKGSTSETKEWHASSTERTSHSPTTNQPNTASSKSPATATSQGCGCTIQ